MSELGLYRVGGSLASVNALKAAIDSGARIDFNDDRWYDINVVSGTFKAFMRELPVRPIDTMSLEQLRRIAGKLIFSLNNECGLINFSLQLLYTTTIRRYRYFVM